MSQQPVPDSVIKLYFNNAPNPMKVVLLLEELGLSYEAVPVDMRLGQQFSAEYLRVNPNAKVPAILENDYPVFDSNAVLLYLGDKMRRFVVPDFASPKRGEMLSWLMFIASGVGPFSGQAVHFRHLAPSEQEYSLNRYSFEARRHWKILDDRLSDRRHLVDDEYGIVDMAFWGWARLLPHILGTVDPWPQYPNVKRLLDEISVRPAALRAKELVKKFAFKKELDHEARRFLLPQNETLTS